MDYICAGFPIWGIPIEWECPTCKHKVESERMTDDLMMEIFTHEHTHKE